MHFKKSNDNQSTILHEGSVPYLTFKKLDQAGVRHGFSTRMGGVSEGMFSALNLSYNRGDKKEAVDEKFQKNLRSDRIRSYKAGIFKSDS